MFLAALLVFAICLVLIGLGIVAALFSLGCASLFGALGIISSSALIAMIRGRLTSGLRAFHYQICGALGMPCGMAISCVCAGLFQLHFRHRYLLVLGSLTGLLAGIAFALILDRFARFAYHRIVTIIPATEPERLA